MALRDGVAIGKAGAGEQQLPLDAAIVQAQIKPQHCVPLGIAGLQLTAVGLLQRRRHPMGQVGAGERESALPRRCLGGMVDGHDAFEGMLSPLLFGGVLHQALDLGPEAVEVRAMELQRRRRLPVVQPATGRTALPLGLEAQGFGPLPASLVIHSAAIGATAGVGPVGLVAVGVSAQAGVEPLLAGPVAAAGRIEGMDHGRGGRRPYRLGRPGGDGGPALRVWATGSSIRRRVQAVVGGLHLALTGLAQLL